MRIRRVPYVGKSNLERCPTMWIMVGYKIDWLVEAATEDTRKHLPVNVVLVFLG